MKKEHQKICEAGGGGNYSSSSGSNRESSSTNKEKIWEKDQDADDMDVLLAILDYKVRSSDIEDVAQKMQHLEMVMGTAQEDGISHIAYDTVHYNPSDLSSWVRSMLTGLNNPPTPDLDLVFLFFPIRFPNTNKLLAAIIPRFIMMILSTI
ncbi:hypothetical protein HRI_004351100 [Hibiscus trionum]|uniref:Transcriptional factor DELLA N-terminal domain-containing protein n=1 Tax=Hibiscus trionum TaxID=183268 RepID=A0A9W7MLS1_HIBTR|nr:hypothetical protein HRI_004351100 [Hibiscus trionum]